MEDELMHKMLSKKKPTINISLGFGMDDEDEDDGTENSEGLMGKILDEEKTPGLAPEIKDKINEKGEGESPEIKLKQQALNAYVGEEPEDYDEDDDMQKMMSKKDPSFGDSVKLSAKKRLKFMGKK